MEKKSRRICQQMQQTTTTTVTRRKTRTKKVNDRLDRSSNIYQRIHSQTEIEIGPWIPEYDSDEQQDQNCLNQHSTEYQLQENQFDTIGKDFWKQR